MPDSTPGFPQALGAALLRAVADKGYAAATAIQSQAIPAILEGRDIVASASTGSGKTVAFALPLLHRLAGFEASTPRALRGLILVPTRELASQAGDVIASLARYLPRRLKVLAVFGGVSINPQMMDLRGGADIVVATPGRLLDLIDRNALTLASVGMLVLDEADRLLDLGFGEEIGRILKLLPAQRQNLFFSATFPPAIALLAKSLLRDPLRIEVRDIPQAAPDIVQRAIEVDARRRTQMLRHLIQNEGLGRALVFVATKHAAEIVADKLRKAGIAAEPFHGELSQGKRKQVLFDFKQESLKVVVATDVAARGIDIAGLPAVINYDLPRSPVDYIHRIGRTGRAGESGLAISFVSAGTEAHFHLIEKRQRLAIEREQVAGFEPADTRPVNAADPSSTGGIKGKRLSRKDKLRQAASGLS